MVQQSCGGDGVIGAKIDVRSWGPELAKQIEPGHPRHAEIQQKEIGRGSLNEPHDVFARTRFSTDFEARPDIHAINVSQHIWRDGKQLTQARAKERFVIGEKDSDRAWRVRRRTFVGRCGHRHERIHLSRVR